MSAQLLPLGNLLVMMKPQSLQLHSVKDGFGRRCFNDARQGCGRLGEKLLADQRIRISYITGIPPINDNFIHPTGPTLFPGPANSYRSMIDLAWLS
jgi:hypothetical protein